MRNLACYLREEFEREREDIARQLHDELGGYLAAAQLELSLLERELIASGSVQSPRIERIKTSLATAFAAKRRAVDNLYPSLLVHIGLFATLTWYAEDVAEQTGARCVANVPEEELPLKRSAAIALYRVSQDVIAAALKHNPHADIEVAATVSGGVLEVSVTGPRPKPPTPGVQADDHYVVQSMRSRMAEIGGRLIRTKASTGRARTAFRLTLAAHLR